MAGESSDVKEYDVAEAQNLSPKSKSPEDELVELCVGFFCSPERYLSTPATGSEDARPAATIHACGKPILSLLCRQSKAVHGGTGEYELVMKRLSDLIDLAKEKFYAFPFKDVPSCWMELFREASFVKVSALVARHVWGKLDEVARCQSGGGELDCKTIDYAVRALDMALIMAGPPADEGTKEAVNGVLELLGKCSEKLEEVKEEVPPSKRRRLNNDIGILTKDKFPATSVFQPPVTNPIPRVSTLSFAAFEAHMHHPANPDLGPEPLIITAALSSWPAFNTRHWDSPSYFLSKTISGRRLVPIETGRSYVDAGWGQSIIPFREFLETYITNPSSTPGYLAQHDLFSQIPSLRNDIAVPDYCYTTPSPPHHSSPLATKHTASPRLEDPVLNAWFGPAGTISPLHTDPYHNILTQVVGSKYVRLYAPRESAKLYARGVEDGGVDMENTSAVDVGVWEGWDGSLEEAKERWPMVEGAEYVDCVLREGEALYIPVGWWHYVRSLSVSFSVSFWWN